MRRKLKIAAVSIVVMIAVVFAGRLGFLKLSESVVEAEITNTIPKDGRYLVFTKDATYEVTDSVFYWRFDSSDPWGKIAKGERYRLTVVGFRFPPMSWYSNIVGAERIGKAPAKSDSTNRREHQAILKSLIDDDIEDAVRLPQAHGK